MSTYSQAELDAFGFAFLGSNARISTKCSLYGASRISIGDNVRIDDFAVISAGAAGISIGNHVHVAVMATMIGHAHIELADFAGLSGKVSIYSSTDDFSGEFLTGPTLPAGFTKITSAPVRVGRHGIIGTGAVLLPGTQMMDGSALGALSLASGDLMEFTIYAGIPARPVGPRRQDLLALEKAFLEGLLQDARPDLT